jgi:hypothetical protein
MESSLETSVQVCRPGLIDVEINTQYLSGFDFVPFEF